MDSIQPLVVSSLPLELTDKQRDLLNSCQTILDTFGIKVIVNELHEELTGQTVAVDVEHDESGIFVGCGIYIVGSSRCYYFNDLDVLSRVPFQSFHVIAHNGKTDLELLRQWGIDISNDQLFWDTLLIGHIIDSSLKGYGLKSMAKRELGIEYPSYDDIVGKRTAKQSKERTTLDKQPSELVAAYNACDCVATAKLYEKQQKDYKECTYFEQIEKPISFILQKMENRGINIDIPYLLRLKNSLEDQKKPVEREIKNELGNINLNSPKQLLEALNEKGIYPAFKGKASTDKRALQQYSSNRIVSTLQQYSEIETLLSSFVKPYLERGQEVVHPYFNQCGTRTGRLSCSNPNLLQIPRRTENGDLVRRMFIARKGMVFGECDYSAIEPRILAHLSQDNTLCHLFNVGTDFHQFTADKLRITRDRAKILNLSVGYRATFKSVSTQLKCSDREAQNEINKWWALFPDLRRWQDQLLYGARKSGFITTLLGRRIKVDNLSDGNSWKREAAERQAINNITQGSAAEVIKRAMIVIDQKRPHFGLLVQVYDSLLFESSEIEESYAFVVDQMEQAIKLKVPLVVAGGIGNNWSECK